MDQLQEFPVAKPDWVAAMVGNQRFKFSARVHGVNSGKMRLIATHLASLTTAELEVCGVGNADIDASRSELCEKLAMDMLAAGIVEHGITLFARLLRCEYANRLIQIISSYGRGFFYSRTNDRVAQLSYSGRVYLHDQTGAAIEVHSQNKWKGFSHDSTLRDLILELRNYVMRGERIDLAYIGIDRRIGGGNFWGYSADQIRLCREAAAQLPIINAEPLAEERAA
jgi:hypothetical protein